MAKGIGGKSIAQMLMESAQQDVTVCNLLAGNTTIGDAVIGFHAQQAVEKSIKAVLSQHGIEFRRTHDLITLLDLLQDKGLPPPPQAHWLDELNPYAVEARYGTIEPDNLDRNHVLKVIAAVFGWAQVQIATGP
jgi:HEPN domain-containing protein